MSARDSESGSSSYKGGSGRAGGLGNGGIGGGMGGGGNWGGGGGGSGRNGGMGNRTGLSTGKTAYGNTAFGRPGGMAAGYAMRDMGSLNRAGMGPAMGSYGGFRGLDGSAMFAGSPVQGQSFNGMNAGQAFGQAQGAYNAWRAAQAPTTQIGDASSLPSGPRPASAPPPAPNPLDPMAMYAPNPNLPKPRSIQGWLPGWPGTGQWWGNTAPYQNNMGLMTHRIQQQPAVQQSTIRDWEVRGGLGAQPFASGPAYSNKDQSRLR